MKQTAFLIAIACVSLAGVAAFSRASAADHNAVTITLPPDARVFAPGPGQSLAQSNCTICHAADYVYLQPALTAEQWHAEVIKMKNVFGAPINAAAVDELVAYLVDQNGKR